MEKFNKQLNDYRSQVLWRIKDCEELLKSRVATQELNDQLKAIETRLKATYEMNSQDVLDRTRKSYDDSLARIKTVENYVVDKMELTKEEIKFMEKKFTEMATKDQIEKLHEGEKQIKTNFQMETCTT